LDVATEQYGPSAPHAHGLECGGATQQGLVVGKEDRRRGIDQADAGDSGGEQRRHAATRLPSALRSGRAVVHDSSISAAGSESQTIPPPTQRWTRASATASVLIVSASSKSPSGRSTPSAPMEAPRPTGSSEPIRSTAEIFGAPVTDPPGKVAARISARPVPSTRRPSTVDTRWVTPASSCW